MIFQQKKYWLLLDKVGRKSNAIISCRCYTRWKSSTWAAITKAFAANNQQVDFLYYSDLPKELLTIKRVNDADCSMRFFINLKTRLLEKVISFRPEVIFGVTQLPLNDMEILSRLKKVGIILFYWFTEDYRIFDYWKSIAPCFDYFFTIQQNYFWQ
jgi:hypothetical protein